jgi:hypothetical protein
MQLCAKRSRNSEHLAALCAVFGFHALRGRKKRLHSARQFLQRDSLAGETALTWVLAEARVLLGFVFDVFGCLTFEVTCVRQRDALARQGIMSIARTAGQVWHAVARQVHRRVRHRLFQAAEQARLQHHLGGR